MAFLTLLFGIYRAMEASSSMWDVARTLFSFTINPSLMGFNALEERDNEHIHSHVRQPRQRPCLALAAPPRLRPRADP
eukprot:1282530-Prymnesium_polylepis.2